VRIDPEDGGIAPLLTRLPRRAEVVAGSEISLLNIALQCRPHPSPTPSATAVLASGEALAALARRVDSKDLSVRTLGRGGAVYALVEHIGALPDSTFKRPDMTRLWSPAPGVFSECGFEPTLPAQAISRWLQPGQFAVFRRWGGNLLATGSTPLGAGESWLKVREPGWSDAQSPAGLVQLRLVPGQSEAHSPSALLAESSALQALKRWICRAPAPLLGGFALYADRKFWILVGTPGTLLPPFGARLHEIESSGRRALVPVGWVFAPRLSESELLDALGACSHEVVLVRADGQGRPVPTRIPSSLLTPLNRHLAREAS